MYFYKECLEKFMYARRNNPQVWKTKGCGC